MKDSLNKEDRHAALRIVGIYAMVAVVWIFISDNALRLVTPDIVFLVHLEILKGFFFIIMTAILLYKLIFRHIRQSSDLEKKLVESEERFRTAFAQAAVGQAMSDKELNFIQVNKAFCYITGYTEQELYSMNLQSITHPEDYSSCVEHIEKLLSGKTNNFIMEKRFITKSGDTVWVRNSVAAIRNKLGNIRDIIALSEDITERKKGEVCLSASEEKYRSIFEETKDVIFMSSAEGKFVDINPAGLEWLGYSSLEELRKIDIPTDLYVNAQDRVAFQQLIERQGYVKDFEVQFKKASGQQITVRITATAVLDEKGRVIKYRGIIRDVTLEKTLEHQIVQAQKMEAVGQLAGGIAHDFNNILSAITGYGHLVLMQIQEDSPLRPYVEQILDSSERAAMLTQNLLTFSRKQIINPQPVRINEILRKVTPVLSKLIREDIELKLELSAEDSTVIVDRLQIEQVLMNLVTNARDAMPDGGILTIITEKIFMDATFIEAHGYGKIGKYSVISVEDTGAGLDEMTKAKIFEPFFTTKEVGKGTGLGLAMAYGVIKQNNGFINVYSEVGKGTTFRIYLSEVSNTIEQRKDVEIQLPVGGTETILLVEDDHALRKLAVTLLHKYGYTVIEAFDGDVALARFSEYKESIDLLITDVVMPKRSGIEVFEEIKKLNPEMKVLFLSGYAKDSAQKKGIFDTSANFLQKPFSPNTLLEKIREILNHKLG